MAEVSSQSPPSLSEEYSLPVEAAADPKAAEVEKFETPVVASPEEPAPEKIEEAPAVAEESSVPPAAVAEETPDASADAAEKSEEPVAEETTNGDDAGEAEETPEIKLETAPADFRFPTTNQTRHCFTRYVEYHRCIAAKGEDAPECDKFAKYYRSLCPGEWVDKWNEQRENGTFPGPL